MVSLVIVWNGKEIEYLVIPSDGSPPFIGADAFSRAWAAVQTGTNTRRRHEDETRARIAEIEVRRGHALMLGGFRLGLDLFADPKLGYLYLDEHNVPQETGFESIDAVVSRLEFIMQP